MDYISLLIYLLTYLLKPLPDQTLPSTKLRCLLTRRTEYQLQLNILFRPDQDWNKRWNWKNQSYFLSRYYDRWNRKITREQATEGCPVKTALCQNSPTLDGPKQLSVKTAFCKSGPLSKVKTSYGKMAFDKNSITQKVKMALLYCKFNLF